MFSIFRRSDHPPVIGFCESCGQVCTQSCRAAAQLDRIKTRMATQGLFLR